MADTTKVTRIKATDSAKAPTKAKSVRTAKKPRQEKEPKNWFTKMLSGIGGYFKGAWTELKQVRWPTRKATWGLTIAVLLFSAFFVVIILLLDLLFNFLFEQIIA